MGAADEEEKNVERKMSVSNSCRGSLAFSRLTFLTTCVICTEVVFKLF